MLTRHFQLSAKELDELDSLGQDCHLSDGNIVPTYTHILSQHRTLPCSLLYYQEKKLVGFLSAFFFYEDACEISVMVAPCCRRQGFATKMVTDVLPLIISQQIKSVIFSMPYHLNNAWLVEMGFCYQNSEFQMQRVSKEALTTNKAITVRPATIKDIPALCELDSACFSTPQAPMEERFHQLLNDNDYQLFIAQKDGVSIGKTHVYRQQNSARFTDIAILPALQGKGLGSAMLAYCINDCLSTKRLSINLDVETTNHQALNLYTRLGFVIKNAYDFWTISIKSLQKLLAK